MNTRLLSYLLVVGAMTVLPTSLRAQSDDPFGAPEDSASTAGDPFGSTPSDATPASDDPFGSTPDDAPSSDDGSTPDGDTPSSDDPFASTPSDGAEASGSSAGDPGSDNTTGGDATSENSASGDTTSGDSDASGNDNSSADVDARIKALTQLVENQGKIQAELLRNIDQLTQVINDQKAIVEAITRKDSEGKPILSLGNMDSAEFRQEMKGAIYRSLGQGDLVVVNKTTDRRELLVNGMRFIVEPSETKTIRVGVGKVTTELVGYEASKEWTIKEPDYKQTIHIVPTDPAASG